MATNFLYATGTNGWVTTPFNIIGSTDISALTNGSAITGATQGTSGKFSQNDFAHCVWGYVYLTVVTAGWTPTASGVINGWWLNSNDGGTTFESVVATASTSVPALPRAPDFAIPAYEGGTALSAGHVLWSPLIRLPPNSCKVVIQNNTGATTGTGNHTITCAPFAVQY